MIKALIFDYDGVIVDNRIAHIKTWRILFNRYKIRVAKYHLDHIARGRPTKDII